MPSAGNDRLTPFCSQQGCLVWDLPGARTSPLCPFDRGVHPSHGQRAIVEVGAHQRESLQPDLAERLGSIHVDAVLLSIAVIGPIELAVDTQLR